jgi:sialate O-acetylesterase
MHRFHQISTFLLALVFACSFASAVDLKLPFVFSDNMVLQRDMADPIWGQVAPNAEVTVSIAGQTKKTTAGATGQWNLKLDAMPASAKGRPLTIASEGETDTFQNVLVGEVWLCSGQSNMGKPIGEQPGQQPTVNWKQEIAAADHPLIRLLTVPKVKEAGDIKTHWEVCNPATIASEHFSAVAYFFGRKIQQEINVPVGLIHSSWGGTRIEPWTNPEGFNLMPSLHAFAPHAGGGPTTWITGPAPSALYDAMIQPLIPFGIRGAIWYQGESNVVVRDRGLYFDKMKALIGGWRQAWGEGDFPFYYVQLAPNAYSARKGEPLSPEELPEIWNAQRKALSIPHTGMVVTTDLVSDVHDIHPQRKVEVGERLALWALANDYGKKDLVFSGPFYRSMSGGNGSTDRIVFDHAEGLKTTDGKPPSNFEIAGADGKFIPAEARIVGDTIEISPIPGEHLPPTVRFGWSETAMPNLVNGAGLPASPFATGK